MLVDVPGLVSAAVFGARLRYAPAMEPTRIYGYLMTTRERVLDGVRPLTPQQYQREFPFGLKTIGSTRWYLSIA